MIAAAFMCTRNARCKLNLIGKRARLARCEAKLLALDFDHCAEINGYQPAPDCLVGVDDATPLAEASVLLVVDDDALIAGGNVSVITIEEEHLRAFSGQRCRPAGARCKAKQTSLLVPVPGQLLRQLC